MLSFVGAIPNAKLLSAGLGVTNYYIDWVSQAKFYCSIAYKSFIKYLLVSFAFNMY